MQMNDPNLVNIANEFRGRTFGSDFVVEHGYLYDRISIAAGGTLDETTSQWFVNVGAGSSKTIGQTNLSTSRKIDAPQSFSIRAVRLIWKSDVLRADMDTILNSYAFELYVADAWKFRCPVACLPAGGGPTGLMVAASAGAVSLLNNGVPSIESVRTLALPILIESGVSFFARLAGTSTTLTASGGSGGTGFTCHCVLEGLHARPTVG